ncbi:hypothetical protein [Desulfomonile tiedjei]|uniref:Uncharacterized protein n=1 Tax=Desulfomonile tiedjei (strain ATCC 49306 / DSM 6799 / DCB-1) TaxID=706587 RepID=I4CEP8_DESTA|nr:hypothetical protein [Desulfomonile tiedjei]AFM28039.1 hypothetical protein Desti_5454 [Desulfomonile tiedjei DSM 6799]
MVRIFLVFTLFIMVCVSSGPVLCQSFPTAYPGSLPGVRPCTPQRQMQPVARSVNVTVPVPQPPKPYMPPTCAPAPYCPPPAAAAPSRPMPVRVDIAVRPEACDRARPVPVVYRDPGFLGPIISHSIGLIGATIAAPFRVAEMLCPLDAPACPPKRPCGPPPYPANCGYPPPAAPQFAPKCPVPITQPVAPCPPALTCAPCGPSVAPLPPCASPPPCAPFIPPAVVERDQEPPCAPQSLLGGLMQLPFTLAERGRFIGDMGRSTATAGPAVCR